MTGNANISLYIYIYI